MHIQLTNRRASALLAALISCATLPATAQQLALNDSDYFAARGANVLVFSNPPGGTFNDAKTSGVEIIQHGVRVATNGDVRLQPTPEQWDPLGEMVKRNVQREGRRIDVTMRYRDENFSYRIESAARKDGIALRVYLDKPLPEKLAGRAGLNLEFLPAEYFGRGYLADGNSGLLPRYPAGPMRLRADGESEPQALARGRQLVLAPEDPQRRIRIAAADGTADLQLFDGRNKAQNGWYVVRSLLPAHATGKVAEWFIHINTEPGWTRAPVIEHSQLGYHPAQQKRALIELDPHDSTRPQARLLQVTADGKLEERFHSDVHDWGHYLRYDYATFDFSSITAPGLYVIEYGEQRSAPFRIADDIYADSWQLTLDLYFPVQMDHMRVREAYRVWHGASHLDDALQAPVNYEHFDLYAQGPQTETRFKPLQHIPGLDTGGWYDAGDYDIRTQSQYATVRQLVHAWEDFGIDRDNTTVSQAKRYTQIHLPDGKSDIVQQIEHGSLALLAQFRAVGHAIPGIVAAHLYQYPHLGDGSTKTDNLVYDPQLDPFAGERKTGSMFAADTDAPRPAQRVLNERGRNSGAFDDRWAFTNRSSALNYGSAAGLAAASRALRGYNDKLAAESLHTAQQVWDYENAHSPVLYHYGNTTGGRLEEERLKAAVELLKSTGERRYADAVRALLPQVRENFAFNIPELLQAMPQMDDTYRKQIRALAEKQVAQQRTIDSETPFDVPITRFGWAGNSAVVHNAIANYYLHRAFPDLVDTERVYAGLNYLFGTRPGSSTSFVSGVGAHSQTVAYGNNRADFSFIPGGVVPGVLVLPPDFPENKENWPFFWGQNEYVITLAAAYLYLANAGNALLAGEQVSAHSDRLERRR
ncbi:glycoside hydrolase family 9 protein [Microbulbifer hainanensis]|uniref:glycoside hydrolase family 9 protein n=1 Tax=Microbulbifer hainanensis TaxID=2735675 RepID=UPI001868F698|nr:glycoside hydrolase family 9 protein [Microbulbifer hainanensis]